MNALNFTSQQEIKKALREKAHARRKALPNREELSRQICEKFVALPAYAAASTILFYLDARCEVRTRDGLGQALRDGKRLAVPYCVCDELQLFCLHDLTELELGRFQILEPKSHLRGLAGKRIDIQQVDLAMVPGVAFDRRGARLGHGCGYYDKLLMHARPETSLVGLAYDCQLVDEIPTQPHDIFMHKLITESAVYACR